MRHPSKMLHNRWVLLSLLGLVACLTGLVVLLPGVVAAEKAPENQTKLPAVVDRTIMAFVPSDQEDPSHIPPDQSCRLCHEDSDQVHEFPSGESLAVMVDLETLSASVHGLGAETPLACTDCHPPADYQIPHTPVEATDQRGYEIEKAVACERCHQLPHITSHPGPQSNMPVVCTDCHSAHDVVTAETWHDGQGDETESCVDCHDELGIERTDAVQLTQIIRGGFFAQKVDQNYCLSCHSQPGLTLTFQNGDVLPLTIDAETFNNSVHGQGNPWQPLDCTDCHGKYIYPHEGFVAGSEREYHLNRYTFCGKCHERNYALSLDGVHGEAIVNGQREAAVCTDCHGAHDTPKPNEPRERISHTCEQCHSTIFAKYSESVHGEALLIDSNLDVPTCIECHGVHDINDPTTALARQRSPELCAGCHADVALMSKYDISTDVFETYVADFHGTTVTLFESDDPNVETNKAVCYDCHGVHDIRPVDDPDTGIKANLLERCQECHPNANENFSNAWTSHFRPSLEHNPLVYLVEQFYIIIIPVTVAFLGFLVATDIFRRVRMRLRR